MNRKIFKRATAMLLAAVLTAGAAMPAGYVYAGSTALPEAAEAQKPAGDNVWGQELPETDAETVIPEEPAVSGDASAGGTEEQEPVLYDAGERTDLMENEIATAEDIVVAAGYGFDVENDFEGIAYDRNAVKASFYHGKGSFDGDRAGDYDTYYKIMPESGREAYLIHRTITVKETGSVSADTGTAGNGGGDGTDDGDPDAADADGGADGLGTFPSAPPDLALGEMQTLRAGSPVTFKLASISVMKAAAATAGDSLKVSSNGYAKYCGHSMGIKYISSSGDYHNHLVYCMDINKNTTNGTVKSGSTAKVKPQITYCLVNGARTLNGKCHNDKYSAGSASEDYFITGAAVHVLNGEVKLSYYNNGSGVYKKIAALVEDAKKYKETEYADNGLTKSITYDISPKKSEWVEKGDGLYRSADKFVRTKSGTVKNVKYTVTGAPSGLTVGEIKKDSSEIDNEDDLKKYDICVAQTDASKPSSNFYLYCNAEALAKIQAEKAVIKVKAKAYSDEKGGRKWTPTVVSQQKITFLEEFTDVKTDEATARVTAGDFKQGYFSLKKTDKFRRNPVPGAKYYLYEDKDCEDLFCRLAKTTDAGLAQSTTELLTQDTYYLKEVMEADGYQRDETVYEIPLKYFTIVDAAGKVTQKGEVFSAVEIPEPVSVAVDKTDAESGNTVKGAGFAVFYDQACTKRVTEDGTAGGTEVPVFYFDEDTELAVSAKFAHIQETYYVKEVVVPDPYKDNGKVIPVKPDNGAMEEVPMDNTPARYGVDAAKEDAETKEPQGDAKLEGAVYGLYAAEDIQYPDGRGIVAYAGNDNITSTMGTEFQSTGAAANKDALLATVKTDGEGRFNFVNLYYGNYYIKEISESEGYLLDSTVYPVNFKEEEKHKDITVQRTVRETVKKQPFSIIKVSTDGDEKETDYVKDAEFTVKLLSEIDKVGWDAAKSYDTLITDEKGYAVSKELPYGKYLVKETKVPKDFYKTDDFMVEISEDSREPQKYRVLNDAPFKAYIRFVKKDAETGKTVLLSGVTFKIREAGTEDFITQKVGDKQVSEFVTDETGTVTTPLRLKYGDYECVEVTAPEGYLVSEKAFPFSVHMDGVVKVEEDVDGDPVIAVEISNKQVKGSITVRKQGEMLSSIGYDSIIDRLLDSLGGEERTIHFNYEKRDLAGAEFQVIAAENIYTPDNQKDDDGNRVLAVVNDVPATEGAVLATLTTDRRGEAVLDGLPLGKYKIVEVKAPAGFVVDDKPQEVELKYGDQETEVVYGEAEFEDVRIKPEVSIVKTDGVTKKPVAGATYGLYAADNICMESGIVENTVPGEAAAGIGAQNTAEESGDGTGEKGSSVSEGGEENDTDDDADISSDDDADSEDIDDEDEDEYPEEEWDAESEYTGENDETADAGAGSALPVQTAGAATLAATSETVSGGAAGLSSAASVAVKPDKLIATAVTDEDGNAVFDVDLPLGRYYVKEIAAPEGYLKDGKSYPVDFTYRPEMAAKEEAVLEIEDMPIIVEVSKKDITTGKEIDGAKLEIIDDKGKVYASWTTDGKPYQLEAVPAGKYTLKETFAPYGYMIANEVKFTVDGGKVSDGSPDIQKVEMTDERVKGYIEIYKTDSMTKKPIKGVSFELQNKEGKVLAVLKTDRKGYARTELLDICTYKKDGSYDKDIPYYIVESKTAEGYILDRTKHEVFLQYDDSAVEPVAYTLKVKNKPKNPDRPKLPQTGGDYHPWLFGLVGGVLVVAGMVLYRRRRRRTVR